MDNAATQNASQIPEEEDIYVTLDLENGETDCSVITIFELNGRDYIVLHPIGEDDDLIYIYRYFEDEEGNPSIEYIDDDKEYEAVDERFDELMDEAMFEE